MTKATTSKSTGRYSIGEKIIAVAIRTVYPGKCGNAPKVSWALNCPPHYIAREFGAKVAGMVFKEFEVVEHHKVHLDYDGDDKAEPTCDGYILKDEFGILYTNQFPRASYGQMSDRGNYIFTIDDRGIPDDQINAMVNDDSRPYRFIEVGQLTESMDGSSYLKDQLAKLNEVGEENTHLSLHGIAYVQEQLASLVYAFNSKFGQTHTLQKETFHKGIDKHGKPYELKYYRVKEKQPATA